MEVGLIVGFDPDTEHGSILSSEGEVLRFSFEDGQNFCSVSALSVPQFTGRHDQPGDFKLKMPKLGDPVVFVSGGRNGPVQAWGYAESFVAICAHMRHAPD
jgi:hypothetical protein